MISEKWNLDLDIDKLVTHLKECVFQVPKTAQSENFGGWSVLSGDGTVQDGWQPGHLLYRKDLDQSLRDEVKSRIKTSFRSYTTETPICTGYLLDIINILRQHELEPHRARIICLKAGRSCVWHRDAGDSDYAVRLHIPIITNKGCFFETRDEREHLPADGSAYFIHVNRDHRVTNEGDEDRHHLVVGIYDHKGVSQFHKNPEPYT